ncbi:MAG: hypothetical protein SH856_03420 [Flavobacteriales bacterium]|nr:hypothetical protein [Flavobacteriales bacterium]
MQNIRTKFFSFFLLSTASILFSCNETPPGVPLAVATTSTTDSIITVSQSVFKFSCVFPKEFLSANPADIHFNDASGELEMKAGEDFGLVMTEGKPNLAYIKKDLEEDLMWKVKMVENDSRKIVYQRHLPDGSAYLMQFIQHIQLAGKDYTVRTAPQGSFNEQQLEVMRKVVDSMNAI